MLQRRRTGAKQLSIHCSLRHTTFVAPSLKTCHSTLARLPIKNRSPQHLKQSIYPSRLNERNENRRTTLGTSALGWCKLGAFTNPMKEQPGARSFPYSTMGYQTSNWGHTIVRKALRNKCAPPGLGASVSRRNFATSRRAIAKTPLAERLRALEKTMGGIKDKGKLAAAHECLSVFEKAIKHISAPENRVETPAITSSVNSAEGEETTVTTVEATTTTMTCQSEPGQVLLESLEFTPEPEPYDPLMEFQIPDDILKRRQLLRDGTVNKAWSHLLYQNEDKKGPRVHYCKTVEEANKVAALFLGDKAVGFDLEWDPWAKVNDPSPRTQVSLMQIANQSDIALFHISLFKCNDKDIIPDNLRKVLTSEDILKVGVNVGGDALRVHKYLGITMQGAFELSDFKNLLDTVRKGGGYIPKRMVSLANLTEETLLLPLPKGKVRLSQWKKALTEKQISYAAGDAYAGLRIFDVLQTVRSKLRPCPPLPKCRVLSVLREGSSRARKVSTKLISSANIEEDWAEPISRLENDSPGNISGESGGSQRSKGTEEADKWVAKYMEEEGSLAASGLQLRAYAMWYDGGYGIEEISKLWRNPPLQLRTVADYILGAIRLESLPYEKEKVKELIKHAGPASSHFIRKWM